jgi:hypothetical protein
MPRFIEAFVDGHGVKTVDGAEDAKFPARPIALQFGKGTVKFRKVEIKPL